MTEDFTQCPVCEAPFSAKNSWEAAPALVWRDIATCPKDGTEFLAFDETTGKFDVCHVYQHSLPENNTGRPEPVQMDGEWGPSYGEFGAGIVTPDGDLVQSKITKWAHLPSAEDMNDPT